MEINVLNMRPLTMALDAWTRSRPNSGPFKLQDVIEIDAPVNDFPDFVLEIKCTIVEREIIASLRDVVMWAQTSRVEDPINFTVPERFQGDYIESLRDEMKKQRDAGADQDSYRLMMPLVAETSFVLKISYRTLIKLAKYFATITDFRTTATSIMNVFGWMAMPAVDYAPIEILHDFKHAESGRISDMITITDYVPFSLRTHLIRHRLISMRDGLKSIIENGSYKSLILSDNVYVTVSADVDVWRDIYSKRSCWLAHYGMWGSILKRVSEYMEISETELPCVSGVCPYGADAQLRVEGKDPNPPCPIHMGLGNLKINELMKNTMKNKVAIDKRLPFWNEKIERLEIIK